MSTISTSPSLVSVHSSMPGLEYVDDVPIDGVPIVVEDDTASSAASDNAGGEVVGDRDSRKWAPKSPEYDPWGTRGPVSLETLESDLSSLRGNQTSLAINIQKVYGLVENQETILQSLRPAIYQSSQYMRGRVHNLVTDNCNRLQVCCHR